LAIANFSVMKKNIYVFGILLGVLFFSTKVYAAIRYVKPGSTGTAPYTSWATASNDLQAVINAAVAGDEIWVAAGTYLPNRRANALTVITVTDRDNAFILKNNVKIFGGFTGVETLQSQRNAASNLTILSGDIGATGIDTDNCFHVVISAGAVGNAELNGFTVTKGNANINSVLTPIPFLQPMVQVYFLLMLLQKFLIVFFLSI
jgi:hypothetical protein